MKSILLQVIAELPEQVSEELVAQESMLDLAMKGGIILIPIIILFAIAIYLLVERYLTIKKASRLDEDFMSNIKDMVLNDNLPGALRLCEKTNTPIELPDSENKSKTRPGRTDYTCRILRFQNN